MRLALISDIHANAEAFAACLAAAGRLGTERLVLLGDLVGYGPDPEVVVARARELAGGGAILVRGNHDEAMAGGATGMNPIAAAAVAWTRQKLAAADREFLLGLPLTANFDDLLFVHADASAPARWNYVTEAEAARRSLAATGAKVTFCGHVHVPQLYCLTATAKLVAHRPVTNVAVPLAEQRQWLAVLGAAGQPRDGNPAAAFATYDTLTRELTYHRAPYDVEAVAAKVRAAGLPEALAERLLEGR